MINARLLKSGAVAATLALATAGGFSAAQAATKTGTSQTRSAAAKPSRAGDTARLQSLATKLGVTAAQLEAAFEAARPAAAEKPADRRGDLAADLAAALNVETAKVQTILGANRPARSEGRRPARGTRPAAPASLVTALATGLSIDEATVKAALTKLDADRKADHDAHHAAMVAAIAKELGLTTEKVEAAFEAAGPPKPRR